MRDFCRELKGAILAVSDGEADPRTARQVADHVAGCDACRERLAALGAPPALPRLALPPELMASMARDLEARLDALGPTPGSIASGPGAGEPAAPDLAAPDLAASRPALERPGSAGLFGWMFAGTLSIPKPVAWVALIAMAFLATGRPAAGPAVPPSPPPPLVAPAAPTPPAPPGPAPEVLLDGVDRLGSGLEQARG